MELEDLKKAWSDYNEKLNENLQTNKKLLREINLDRAKSAMDTPKNYELSSLVLGGLFFIYVLSSTVRFSGDIKLLTSGILTSIWCVIMTCLTIYKLKALTDLDFYSVGVIEIQKKMISISKRYLASRRFEIYSFPFFAIVATPILAKAMRGYYIFNHPEIYLIGVGGALLLGYPLVIWIYKHWYKNKINKVDSFVAELTKFESEQ
jgi:nitrate reductase NapE component